MKIYQKLARLQVAYNNCIHDGNDEWRDKHLESIHEIMKSAPHGSGIDTGITWVHSCKDELRFTLSFHHLDENGMYDRWTDHDILVTPSLSYGIYIRIGGDDYNDIKEYLHQVIANWLDEEIP